MKKMTGEQTDRIFTEIAGILNEDATECAQKLLIADAIMSGTQGGKTYAWVTEQESWSIIVQRASGKTPAERLIEMNSIARELLEFIDTLELDELPWTAERMYDLLDGIVERNE